MLNEEVKKRAIPKRAFILKNQALVFQDLGDYDRAESLVREALVLNHQFLGPKSPGFSLTQIQLADLMARKGEYTEAECLAREAQAVFRNCFPMGHWNLIVAESVIGQCLTGQGHFLEVEDLLLSSYKSLRFRKGEQSQVVRSALERVISLYEQWGKPEQADRYEVIQKTKTGALR